MRMTVFKDIVKYLNPFDTISAFNTFNSSIKTVMDIQKSSIDRIIELECALSKARVDASMDRQLFLSLINECEDMVWAKDVEGRYIVCNEAFRAKFCYNLEWSEIRGKTDKELVKKFISLVGELNHTFSVGEKDYDKIIFGTGSVHSFVEEGIINGKLIRIDVKKSPVFDKDGTLFAVSGIGKDVTVLGHDIVSAIETCSHSEVK